MPLIVEVFQVDIALYSTNYEKRTMQWQTWKVNNMIC